MLTSLRNLLAMLCCPCQQNRPVPSQTDIDALEEYRYSVLVDPNKDLRLLTLLPGDIRDPIKISIRHVSLVPKYDQAWNAGLLGRDELQQTLPSSWKVYETMNQRYLFVYHDLQPVVVRGTDGFVGMYPGRLQTTWIHPDESISASQYQILDQSEPFEPEYEALSYTWGSKEDQRINIIVEETLPSASTTETQISMSRLSVTKNLFEALTHLRATDKARTLWIDAICLNQKDFSELDVQVKRMGDIYKSATRVVAFLGPKRDNSGHALSVLEYLGKQIQPCDNDYYIWPDPEATQKDWYNPETRLPYDESTWAAIAMLLHRPWFWRRWIIQEIYLANPKAMLQCGQDQISWTVFRTACAHLFHYNHRPLKYNHTVGSVYGLCSYTNRYTFCELIMQLYYAGCQNERDKIYAIHALIPRKLAQRIQPQYSDSVANIFRNAFLADLDFTCRLEFLNLCYLSSRQIDKPFWVPDLTAALPVRSAPNFQFSSGFSRAHAVFETPDILTVEGTSHGAVLTTSQQYTNERGNLSNVNDLLQKWFGEIQSQFDVTSSRAEVVRTLCLNNFQDRFPAGEDPSVVQWRLHFFPEEAIFPEPSVQKRSYDINPIFLGRCFFLFQSGLLGVGPPGTQRGDIICVILGCDSPILLRPNTDNTFKVVGKCFVASLLDSVGILGPLPDTWTVQYGTCEVTHKDRPYYVNRATEEKTFSDPRLGPLEGWETFGTLEEGESQYTVAAFRNTETGYTINSDPRLSAEALRDRCVQIRSFRLV